MILLWEKIKRPSEDAFIDMQALNYVIKSTTKEYSANEMINVGYLLLLQTLKLIPVHLCSKQSCILIKSKIIKQSSYVH